MANWLHVLTYLRNVCAHHSRLWNANMAVQLAPTHLSGVPALQHMGTLTPGELARSYPVICVVVYLLEQVDPTSSWRTRLAESLSTLPATGRSLSEMGMPDDWGICLGPEESSDR